MRIPGIRGRFIPHRMLEIRSQRHILIFSPHLHPCTYIYLQYFANNLSYAFTHGVICLSFFIVPERVEVPFENHSTPNKRGRSMDTREITFTSFREKME
jgi:hypothetical protein